MTCVPTTTWPASKPVPTCGSACARPAHWRRGQGRHLQQPLHGAQRHHDDAAVVGAAGSTVPPELDERFEDDEVAFISEASVDIVADILPSWSIRAGYEILFLNSIVLAGENFNTASPYGTGR